MVESVKRLMDAGYLKQLGVSEQQIRTIAIGNPERFLSRMAWCIDAAGTVAFVNASARKFFALCLLWLMRPKRFRGIDRASGPCSIRI